MSNFTDSIYKIKSIDTLGKKDTVIHRINPLSKLIVTIIYILTILSFNKYSVINILPLILYQIVIICLGDVPFSLIIKLTLVGIPFIFGIGIFNVIFDKTIFFRLGKLIITAGLISFISIIIKGILTITSGVLLICTTCIEDLAKSLRRIGIPKIFVSQILFTYRYIYVLIENAEQIYNAYMLRAPKQKGVNFRIWGSLLGQLLLRSFDRAQRIYNAMSIRGFDGEFHIDNARKFKMKDFIYILLWIIFFILSCKVNIPLFIGGIIMK